MRLTLVGIGAAVVFTACSQDLCHQIQSVAQNESAQLSGCLGLAIDGGAVSDQQVQTCEANLSKCSSADQSAISSYLSCVSGLPTFQCKWIAEALSGTEDPDLTTYENDSKACEAKDPTGLPGQAPALSPSCVLLGSSGTSSATGTTGGVTTGGSTTGGSTGGSTTGGNPGFDWPGTYLPGPSSSFTDLQTGAGVSLTGAETITRSGDAIAVADFATPGLVNCTLTLTLASSTSNYASTASQSCGGYLLTFVEATIAGSSGAATINLSGNAQSGTDTYTFSIDLVQTGP